jgi:UDP-3-O-[3-hydroxymyristoyl] glucosamine N-acyltransferase
LIEGELIMAGGERASYTLREIAERFGGELVGDSSTRISQVATLESAEPHAIAFLASARYLPQLRTTKAGAVILGAALREATGLPRIVCGNPYAYFARLSAFLNPQPPSTPGVRSGAVVDAAAIMEPDVEVGPLAVVGRAARLGAGAIVGAGCFIGDDVVIGRGTRLYPNVTIYHGCRLGERVIVHAGVVIGADGFGMVMADEEWIKIPQIGGVVIGNDVEIGANTTIDRGTMDDTVIEDGVKLDNQIQIAHNVRIGAHTAIAACAGVAGSARIGRYCRIGGSSGIAGHLTIADHVEISAHTLIMKSIEQPGTYTGAYPFDENAVWRRNAAHLRHLGELADRLKTLERWIAAKERSGS